MAQIYLTSGENYGIVGAGSNTVTGTNANETVTVAANGDAIFDGSFNRGGDVINISGNAGDYTASISGNFLVLTGVNGTSTSGADIRIPIGTGAGASIKFADAPARTLSSAGTTVTLGSQTIPLSGSVDVTDGVGNVTDFILTPGQNTMTGTQGSDFFLADMVQNDSGLQVNSLGTGDNLNGSGGADELQAQITRAATFDGNGGIGGINGGSNIPVQPRLNSIEVVKLEAINADLLSVKSPINLALSQIGDIIEGTNGPVSLDEFADFSNNTEVYFNAKNVRGHDEIWSWYSDANLTVQDLTTIVSNGGHDDARNTSEMTIGMGYTSGQDTFWDSSDYHVFFDQDFLLTGIASESRAFYFLLDEDADLEDRPLLDFIDVDGIRFTIDGGPVITLSDPDAQTAGTHIGFVAALQDALQDLIDAGLVPADTTLYVDPTITDFTFLDDGSQSSPIPAIVLETQTDSVITPVGFSRVEDAIGEYDVYGRFNNEAQVEDLPLSVNIALEKVGRGGEGGDMIVGSMDKYNNGIDVFDVTVYGDDSRPSWLDYLNSTGDSSSGVGQQGELDVINIVSDNEGYPDDDTWAKLTIGATNDDLTLIDAQGFFGDLTLGNLDDLDSLVTLLATGGGDVEFYGYVEDKGPTAYSYSTGGGDDLVDLEINGRALEYATSGLQVSTGGGDDEVFIDYFYNESELPNHIILDNVGINTGDGNDIVSTVGEGRFRINTGAGNDVIYSEQNVYYEDDYLMANNDTESAHWVFNVDRGDYIDEGGAGGIDLDSLPGVPLRYSLLAGATVTVTFSGAGNMRDADDDNGGGAVMEYNGVNVTTPGLPHPNTPIIGDAVAFRNGIESQVTINLSNNVPFKFYGTQIDINKAILSAINDHATLSKLLVAEISANNTLVVSSKIDGTFVTEDLDIHVSRSAAYTPNPASPGTEPVVPIALINEALQLGFLQPGQVSLADSLNQPTEIQGAGFLNAMYGAALDNGFYSGINNSGTTSSETAEWDNLWSAGTREEDQSDHIHNPGTGDDVVVLSTDNNDNEDNEYWTLDGWLFDRASNETIVFQGDFSTINGNSVQRDTYVNFQTAGVEDFIRFDTSAPGGPRFVPSGEDPKAGGFDFLDFTSYLTSQQTTTGTGSQSITRRIAVTLEDNSLENTPDYTSLVPELDPNDQGGPSPSLGENPAGLPDRIDANEVYIVSFDNTGPGGAAETFSGLTAAVVSSLISGTLATTDHGSLTALELNVNTTYSNTAGSGPQIQLVNGIAKAILMVQNADDLGVYKVFEIQWNGLATATTLGLTVTERGTADFGTSLDGLDELNLVGSLEHSLFNFDLSPFTNP